MVDKKTAEIGAYSSEHFKGNDRHVLKDNAGRRPYAAPRVLSSELLELAAAACEPSNSAFGKAPFPSCGQPGT